MSGYFLKGLTIQTFCVGAVTERNTMNKGKNAVFGCFNAVGITFVVLFFLVGCVGSVVYVFGL
jgi:hypothetical protein